MYHNAAKRPQCGREVRERAPAHLQLEDVHIHTIPIDLTEIIIVCRFIFRQLCTTTALDYIKWLPPLRPARRGREGPGEALHGEGPAMCRGGPGEGLHT